MSVPLVLFVYFVKIFNVDLATTLNEATTKALDRMVSFCYWFMFISFLLVFLPFLVLLLLPPGMIGSLYGNMFDSPLSFVVGCVNDSNPDHRVWETVCQSPNSQKNEWLINIGGYVWSPVFSPPVSSISQPTKNPANHSAAGVSPAARLDHGAEWTNGNTSSVAMNDTTRARPSSREVVTSAATTAPKQPANPSPTSKPGSVSDHENGSLSLAVGTSNAGAWYANPLVGRYYFPIAVVSGGITVPFYFIIVALFGASISMAQKIPEYQSQLAEGTISPPKARKLFTIQVLQFISAPFLAIITYAFIGPSGQTATITVGFVAGFSSQTILTNLLAAMNRMETKAASS